ncbi:PX-domain-containing protein [Gigaspora margarita]|uniref:PX-domain-containing protein n=1 Tax=Gigaspora margarita TaxID=4874 RepID=A0A8H4EIG0_GIGMA|nr:PX-domain-containing protein [Gigaspora margarita]
MSSKPRPAIPPKPARLSVNSQKRDSSSIGSERSTFAEESLSESPRSSLLNGEDDTTPRASEMYPAPSAGREARALYDFVGEAAYSELSFRAGDVLNIIRGQLSDGWSLAVKDGVTGLVPEAYITYTTEFTELPNSTYSTMLSYRLSDLPISPAESTSTSSSSIRDSMDSSTSDTMIGSLFGSINGSTRSSTLKKRQLNRFSWFVTTGVEEFIINGGQPLQNSNNSENIDEEVTETDKHYIQGGPSWLEKSPSFKIMVHNPEKRIKLGGVQEYTIFHVTSMFSEGVQITVERRFSQFEWLYNRLVNKFGAFVLPPLPEKQYSGRFNEEFIEKRRRALERFINRLARHPIIRYSEILTHFLSCNDDSEWRKREKQFENDKIIGHAFFHHVYHPEFNVDDGEIDTIERFEAHARAMEKLMPWINEASVVHKDSLEEMQHQYRRVSYALLRLITGHDTGENNDSVNDEGAWCWRDGCKACLSLTKALQSTVESMQAVADMYKSHINDMCIPWIENFNEYSYPSRSYELLIDMHMGTHRKFKEVSEENISKDPEYDMDAETIRSRCDTVFNVTLAEIDRIHDERVQDFQENTKQYLDGQIELYEKILEELRQARANFDEPHYTSLSQTPRTPSEYENLIDEQRPVSSRPGSVSSMSDVVGGVVDGVGSMGNFFKKTTKTSMFDSWWGKS